MLFFVLFFCGPTVSLNKLLILLQQLHRDQNYSAMISLYGGSEHF